MLLGMGIFGLLLLLCFVGSIYHYAASLRDQAKYPPQGRLIDIGGYRLHLQCTGKGTPTVILDSGLGAPGLGWSLVQKKVSQFATVCSYDRAGSGWSDASPFPRTGQQVAKELHELLIRANIPGPYILVGHSSGGINLRFFEAQYPQDVAGMVLVDAPSENYFDQISGEYPEFSFEKMKRTSLLLKLGSRMGLSRILFATLHSKYKSRFQPSEWDMITALGSSTKNADTSCDELASFQDNLRELAQAKRSLGNKPLIVISPGQLGQPKGISQERWDRFLKIMMTLQKDFLKLSTQSRHIIVENADHMIPYDHPQVIVDAIHELVALGLK